MSSGATLIVMYTFTNLAYIMYDEILVKPNSFNVMIVIILILVEEIYTTL